MSMIGEYFRLTTADLERALEDPDWALDFIDETRDAEEESEPSPAEARHFSTYKTWDLLGFLLRRSGCPVDVVHGEEPLGQADDWGYGPPRYLPVERVRLGAEALGRMPYDQLIAHVNHQELITADVYPQGWDSAESLDWARDWYSGLIRFFGAAARDGQAVIVWLE
ncbi:YfbM family protein [Streptomyces sp. NPDC051976]|uniref:YfbM family protein n=1 Tax=Streptomyces sp. NPDC051976 TaxID=3154947 RepID=UPI00341D0BB4